MRRPVDAPRVREFMRTVGERSRKDARAYFTGGVTAVLMGWRTSTIDVDVVFEPEDDAVLRALPEVKETLEVNIELVSPAHFIPPLPAWAERSPFIERHGRLWFHHYDPYAQALAKIERGHELDRRDVQELLGRKLVDPERLRELFHAIVPQLFRYPSLDPRAFARSVEDALQGPPGA